MTKRPCYERSDFMSLCGPLFLLAHDLLLFGIFKMSGHPESGDKFTREMSASFWSLSLVMYEFQVVHVIFGAARSFSSHHRDLYILEINSNRGDTTVVLVDEGES